jgi:hypothetical protein
MESLSDDENGNNSDYENAGDMPEEEIDIKPIVTKKAISMLRPTKLLPITECAEEDARSSDCSLSEDVMPKSSHHPSKPYFTKDGDNAIIVNGTMRMECISGKSPSYFTTNNKIISINRGEQTNGTQLTHNNLNKPTMGIKAKTLKNCNNTTPSR